MSFCCTLFLRVVISWLSQMTEKADLNMPENPKHLFKLNDIRALAVECSHCSIVFSLPVLEPANRKPAKLPQVCPSCDTLWIENKRLDTLVGDFLRAYRNLHTDVVSAKEASLNFEADLAQFLKK
jgi:hypothetical protein